MLKSHSRQSGFTIVELLIVIVIIAILAAISIFGYNGFVTRSKTSAAQQLVGQVIKKTETYNADDTSPTSGYPRTGSQMTTAASSALYRVDGVTWGTPASSTGPEVLRYNACGHQGSATIPSTMTVGSAGAMTTVTGSRIDYYNYSTGAIASVSTGVTSTTGTASASNPAITCLTSN